MSSNDKLNFIDTLNLLSFVIGLMNYDENLTQGDKQDLMNILDTKTTYLLGEIRKDIARLEAKLDEKDKTIS